MRKVIVAIVLFASASIVSGQNPPSLSERLINSWSSIAYLILPPQVKQEVERSRQLPRDYSNDVAAFLKSNSDAPYLCAILGLSTAHPLSYAPIQGAKEMRDRELKLCKAYSPTREQIATVQQWFFIPPPSRREQIAHRTKLPTEMTTRMWGPVYFPPPVSPREWIDGNPTRDFRADLVAEFDRDPLIAAQACVRAEKMPPDQNVRIRNFQKIVTDVCASFPDAKVESAYRTYRAEEGRVWLTGILNSALDESATLTPELRRQRSERLIKDLPRMAAGTDRVETAIHALALTPGDWRPVAALLHHAPEGNWRWPGGADQEDIVGWITDLYAKRGANSPDHGTWQRGERALFVLTGQLDKAKDLARQLAKENDTESHSLDLIYLAAIERSLGNTNTYDRLMTDCPAPDPFYIQQNGRPPRAERYCEDILSDFARAVRDQLHGTPQEIAFAAIARDTNRVTSTTALGTVMAPADLPAKTNQTEDWFSALIKAQEERVSAMTSVQRDAVGEREMDTDTASGKTIGFENAVYSQVLRPWHEGNAAALLNEINHMGWSPGADEREHVRDLVTAWFEKRSANGPSASEWKRGLRGLFFFAAITRELATSAAKSRRRTGTTNSKRAICLSSALQNWPSGIANLLTRPSLPVPEHPRTRLKNGGRRAFHVKRTIVKRLRGGTCIAQ